MIQRISSTLVGMHSDLHGDLSGLSGDLDECEISEEDRIAGVDVSLLVE